jgi:FG-GAP-like repeat
LVPGSRSKKPNQTSSSPTTRASRTNRISRRQFSRDAALAAAAALGAPRLLLKNAGARESPNIGSSSIRFENIAQKAGLHYVVENCPTANKNQPETMAGGVALLDYDRDGYLDIYLTSGAAIPSLEKDSPKYWNRLFHNNHDGTFTDVTQTAGVRGAGYTIGASGALKSLEGLLGLRVAEPQATAGRNFAGSASSVTEALRSPADDAET